MYSNQDTQQMSYQNGPQQMPYQNSSQQSLEQSQKKRNIIIFICIAVVAVIAFLIYHFNSAQSTNNKDYSVTNTNQGTSSGSSSSNNVVANPFPTVIKGYDFPGNDLKYYVGPWENCPTECLNTPGCAGYVTNVPEGKNCWLKSSFPGQGQGNLAGHRDIYAKPLRKYKAQPNFDYHGNDIVYYDMPFEVCGLACDNTPGCVTYTTRKDSNQGCWLKNGNAGGYPVTNRDSYVLDK